MAAARVSMIPQVLAATADRPLCSKRRLSCLSRLLLTSKSLKQSYGGFVGEFHALSSGSTNLDRTQASNTFTTTSDVAHRSASRLDNPTSSTSPPTRISSFSPSPSRFVPTHCTPSYRFRVYLAVGSNLGDRFGNIRRALELLCSDRQMVVLRQTSFLHETAPMYVTDQPAFLNGVVELETNLQPQDLLRRIKDIEAALGRDLSSDCLRNGPRPVDLDIVSYEATQGTSEMLVLNTPQLTIPHPRLEERDFVLLPLIELAGTDMMLPGIIGTIGDALVRLRESTKNQTDVERPLPIRVLPLPRGRFLYFNETIIMGILNVTPDSFSDGGQWTDTIDDAVDRALAMEMEGAGIVDIGGESTRPGAKEVDAEEELQRTIPVIRRIREKSNIPLSIDTRHASVAKAAIEAGADIVNDVSGGMFDETMLATVNELGVPIILMHMRGTPETMQSFTEYDDIVSEVATALRGQSHIATSSHALHRWMQIVDPGIGFAKDLRGNLLLLRNISKLRSIVGDVPILIGCSRKGFIGTLTNVSQATKRDPGTIAACVAALSMESTSQHNTDLVYRQRCNIVRVHNVAECKQAMMIMDAIHKT